MRNENYELSGLRLEVGGKNERLQAVSSLLPSARSAPSDST
jgi:hypothetical protein